MAMLQTGLLFLQLCLCYSAARGLFRKGLHMPITRKQRLRRKKRRGFPAVANKAGRAEAALRKAKPVPPPAPKEYKDDYVPSWQRRPPGGGYGSYR